MNAQTSQGKFSKSTKRAYRPHVQKVAERAYTCQSETYTHILYLVTVAQDGSTDCECTAGQFRRDCKHQVAVRALMAYNAHPQHIRKAPGMRESQTSAAGLLDAFGI